MPETKAWKKAWEIGDVGCEVGRGRGFQRRPVTWGQQFFVPQPMDGRDGWSDRRCDQEGWKMEGGKDEGWRMDGCHRIFANSQRETPSQSPPDIDLTSLKAAVTEPWRRRSLCLILWASGCVDPRPANRMRVNSMMPTKLLFPPFETPPKHAGTKTACKGHGWHQASCHGRRVPEQDLQSLPLEPRPAGEETRAAHLPRRHVKVRAHGLGCAGQDQERGGCDAHLSKELSGGDLRVVCHEHRRRQYPGLSLPDQDGGRDKDLSAAAHVCGEGPRTRPHPVLPTIQKHQTIPPIYAAGEGRASAIEGRPCQTRRAL